MAAVGLPATRSHDAEWLFFSVGYYIGLLLEKISPDRAEAPSPPPAFLPPPRRSGRSPALPYPPGGQNNSSTERSGSNILIAEMGNQIDIKKTIIKGRLSLIDHNH